MMEETATTTAKAVTSSSTHLKWIVVGGVVVACVAGGVVAGVVVSRNSVSSRSSALQEDPFAPSAMPSIPPSLAPSVSAAPSMLPSDIPSMKPSQIPTFAPSVTQVPTASPSASPSTTVPSENPTEEVLWVPPNPVPDNPPGSYFNYDENDDKYGPSAWKKVNTQNHPLREFSSNGWGPWDGHWADKDPTDNRCGGAARQQSPKNLVEAAGGSEPGVCDAGHQIRTWCGSYPVDSDKYERQILPHKLSLVMNRRPCLEIEQAKCIEGEPPLADYPRYSSSLSSYSDMLNFDIKVPGEHSLQGEFFDAEIQMLHTHIDHRRVSSIGVPVRATVDGYNDEFQEILDQFQWVYDEHATECALKRRYLRSSNQTSNVREYGEEHKRLKEVLGRKLQVRPKFDPYSKAIMPGISFYRYDGSITEPPCFPLTWWVMIDPMIISLKQLNQIKYLLFTHVDSDCRKTSVHNANQEVTRPIQPLGEERGIQYCPDGSFQSDEDKGRGEGNKCHF